MWGELGGEPLLLCVERGRLSLFKHLIRIPPISDFRPDRQYDLLAQVDCFQHVMHERHPVIVR